MILLSAYSAIVLDENSNSSILVEWNEAQVIFSLIPSHKHSNFQPHSLHWIHRNSLILIVKPSDLSHSFFYFFFCSLLIYHTHPFQSESLYSHRGSILIKNITNPPCTLTTHHCLPQIAHLHAFRSLTVANCQLSKHVDPVCKLSSRQIPQSALWKSILFGESVLPLLFWTLEPINSTMKWLTHLAEQPMSSSTGSTLLVNYSGNFTNSDIKALIVWYLVTNSFVFHSLV